MSYIAYGAVALVLWFVGSCVYNVFFHPLKAFPGPFLAKVTRWWLFRVEMRGDPHMEILDLHRKYGMIYNHKHYPVGIVNNVILTDNRPDTEDLS